jgi:membrane fusion protein (multidrug efflux system)
MTDYVREEHFDRDETIAEELIAIADAEAAPILPVVPAPPASKQRTRKRGFAALGILVALGAVGYGGSRLLATPTEETDDAYVGGNIVAITARQGGTVLGLHADNTQAVTRGQTLIDLDPAQQDVAFSAAEAKAGPGCA